MHRAGSVPNTETELFEVIGDIRSAMSGESVVELQADAMDVLEQRRIASEQNIELSTFTVDLQEIALVVRESVEHRS